MQHLRVILAVDVRVEDREAVLAKLREVFQFRDTNRPEARLFGNALTVHSLPHLTMSGGCTMSEQLEVVDWQGIEVREVP